MSCECLKLSILNDYETKKFNLSVQQIGTIQISIAVSNTSVAPSLKTLPVLKLCYDILLLLSRETNKNSTRTPEPIKKPS